MLAFESDESIRIEFQRSSIQQGTIRLLLTKRRSPQVQMKGGTRLFEGNSFLNFVREPYPCFI